MTWRVEQADCLEAMAAMDEASIDAIVCDPPYSLGFMGKAWDRNLNHGPWAAEALRVLRPGGHLLAFGGTRTYHRLACAIEDAGFEIRDSLIWLYGSGFPKSLDVSKAIDKAAGAEREVVGERTVAVDQWTEAGRKAHSEGGDFYAVPVTAPATPEAEKWNGWGTALKPSHEPVVVARKPLIGTVAANVQKHGTGALNIDGCRIEATDDQLAEKYASVQGAGSRENSIYGADARDRAGAEPNAGGRWPANLALSPEAAEELDRQSGECANGRFPGVQNARPFENLGDSGFPSGEVQPERDMGGGGASRFFYVAKASRAERNAGLDGFEERDSDERFRGKRDSSFSDPRMDREQERRPAANHHPTVKPIDLMRWLCRLVTPPGGTILDPFAGSGTTGIAAVLEDFAFIGLEREPEYVEIARARIDHWNRQPKQMELA